MKLRTGLLVGLLVTALTITGCSSLAGEKWAAKVNGEKILAKDLDDRLNSMKEAYEKMGMKFETEEEKKALTDLRTQLLEVLIGGKLIAQEVTKLGLSLDDPKVKEQEDEFRKNFTDDVQYQDWLKARGMTEVDLKQNMALYAYVTKDTKVTDEEVEQYFKDNVAQYGGQPEQVKARHILVEKEDEAKAIIAEIKAGKDFAELAKEKSTDPGSKESGGDLGFFTREEMVPEFSNAAFSQKVGDISETPVKSQFGYHVIKVEDRKEAVVPDFKTVKDQVEKDAREWAEQQKIETYFNDLRNKAEIEYEKSFQPAKS